MLPWKIFQVMQFFLQKLPKQSLCSWGLLWIICKRTFDIQELDRAGRSAPPDHYLWKRVRLQGTRLLTIGKHNDGHVHIPIMILARCEIGPTCYPKRKRGITVRASVITPTARCKLSLNRMIIPAQASEWPRAGRTSCFSQIHDSPKAATCLITADFSPGRRFRSRGRLRITSASHYHRSCELLFCHR